MEILVTGGFGNVGRSAVKACIAAGHNVTILESPQAMAKADAGLRKMLRSPWRDCRVLFGDLRKPDNVRKALSSFGKGPDALIHLAALIPPAADQDEAKTWEVNVGGTKNLIEACLSLPKPPRFVLASSIATYGDRLKNFWIRVDDELKPTEIYSRTKVECEALVKASGLEHTILRLSYVVWAKWLPFDPMLFAMPPETRLEVVHTEDAGRAFAAAAELSLAAGRTLNIGGGPLCRTSFRAFLDRIFRYYGLGDSSFLPMEAFAASDFHCGWYADSDQAEELLHFRRKTLEDYYEEVRWETRLIAPFATLAAPAVRRWLIGKSPYIKGRPKPRAGRVQGLLRLSRQEKR